MKYLSAYWMSHRNPDGASLPSVGIQEPFECSQKSCYQVTGPEGVFLPLHKIFPVTTPVSLNLGALPSYRAVFRK